jgi:hypothetical protein
VYEGVRWCSVGDSLDLGGLPPVLQFISVPMKMPRSEMRID